VGWGSLLLFVGATAALLLLVPLARTTEAGSVLRGLAWWENLNLFAILLIVTVGGIAIGLARLKPSDLGLVRGKLLEGIIVVLAAWGAMQLWPLVASGSAEVATAWTDPGIATTLRWAAVMFLATALYEEIAFRGFLLPQIYLKVRGSHRTKLAVALLGSQLVFAAAHIPAHIMIRQLSGGPLLQMLTLQVVAGIMLAILYLRTRNLWIAVGFHGLANAPTPLFGGALGWEIPLLVLLVAWPIIMRRPLQRGLAGVEPR
jgi:membrane protease YdiL (CAAX protease family)